MEEIWKDIEGYEGLYSVSNLGRVKRHKGFVRWARNNGGSLRRVRESIIKPQRGVDYDHVGLCKNGTHKTMLIHRLVGLAFVPNLQNKPQINHKDGNKRNNHFENLEWSTQKENVNHYLNKNLKKNFCSGEKQYNSKLKIGDVLAIKIIHKSKLCKDKEIAALFNMKSPSQVGRIVRGERWGRALAEIQNVAS